MSRTVGIYLFEDVEVLDFAGPSEVFTTASRVHRRLHPQRPEPFLVFSIALTPAPVTARAGLRIVPDFQIDAHPDIDVLIVPGGVVTAELHKPEVLRWVARQAPPASAWPRCARALSSWRKPGCYKAGRSPRTGRTRPNSRRRFRRCR